MSRPTPNGGVWSKSKITKNVPTQLPHPVVYTLMYKKCYLQRLLLTAGRSLKNQNNELPDQIKPSIPYFVNSFSPSNSFWIIIPGTSLRISSVPLLRYRHLVFAVLFGNSTILGNQNENFYLKRSPMRKFTHNILVMF